MENTLRTIYQPKINISFSRIKTFEECELRYFFEYVMGIRGEISEALINGTLTHNALAGVQEEDEEEEQPTSEEVAQWIENGNRFLNSFGPGSQIIKEHEFKIKISKDIFLNGSMDVKVIQRGNLYTVMDYKTNRIPYNPEDTKQLETYALGIFEEHPDVNQVTAGLFFLRYNQFRHAVYTRKDTVRKMKKFYKMKGEEILKKLPKGITEFKAGECYCNSCPQAILCHLLNPRNDADYNSLAAWATRTVAAIDQAKGMLKDYIREHGALPIGSKEWRFNPVSPTKVFNVQLFKERLTNEGFDPNPFLAIDSKAVKQLPDELLVGTYTEKNNSPRFGLYKRG